MAKIQKTNAMRFLENKKIEYTVNSYECNEFIDGVTMAKEIGQPHGAEGVVQREKDQIAILGIDLLYPQKIVEVCGNVSVGKHDRLGGRGGAGGENDGSDVVGIG